jgi:hypothetical protein
MVCGSNACLGVWCLEESKMSKNGFERKNDAETRNRLVRRTYLRVQSHETASTEDGESSGYYTNNTIIHGISEKKPKEKINVFLVRVCDAII